MRHGIVILPQGAWRDQAERWRRAEELGFHTGWTYDHLSWNPLDGEDWGAAIPTLTAAALVTHRLRIGTFVASPNFRHPVSFARELATLDAVSGGRLTLGVGSGSATSDAPVLGSEPLSPRARHARFDEFVRHLDVLLRFEPHGADGIHLDGEWYRAVRARMVGAPEQSPRLPFVIAADGPRGIALAAELGDGWVTLGPKDATDDAAWWSGVAERADRMEESLAATDRDPDGFSRVLSLDAGPVFSLESAERYRECVARAAELGFTDVVAHWPRASRRYVGDERVLDEIAPVLTDGTR